MSRFEQNESGLNYIKTICVWFKLNRGIRGIWTYVVEVICIEI